MKKEFSWSRETSRGALEVLGLARPSDLSSIHKHAGLAIEFSLFRRYLSLALTIREREREEKSEHPVAGAHSSSSG